MATSKPIPDRPAIQRRLDEQNQEDNRQGWMLIILGLPFAVLGAMFLTLGLWLLLLVLPFGVSYNAKFFIAGGVVLAVVAFDTWRHPSEHWNRARYYLLDGRPAGDADPVARDGWFAGMPLMTNMSDPQNVATRVGAIANGCSNVVLAGPRNIRKGIEELRLVRSRSKPQTIDTAAEFLRWLGRQELVTEPEMAEELARHPAWKSGVPLAYDLGFVASKYANGVKNIHLR